MLLTLAPNDAIDPNMVSLFAGEDGRPPGLVRIKQGAKLGKIYSSPKTSSIAFSRQ